MLTDPNIFFAHRSVSKIFVPYRSRGQKESLTDLNVFLLKICKQFFSLQIKRWKRIAYRSQDFFGLQICKENIFPYRSRGRKK